jgi:hypothetical protein
MQLTQKIENRPRLISSALWIFLYLTQRCIRQSMWFDSKHYSMSIDSVRGGGTGMEIRLLQNGRSKSVAYM